MQPPGIHSVYLCLKVVHLEPHIWPWLPRESNHCTNRCSNQQGQHMWNYLDRDLKSNENIVYHNIVSLSQIQMDYGLFIYHIFTMMTSSNGNIFRVTGPLCWEFTGHRWIPAQRPVTRCFDAFFDLSPNKRLSKQSWSWWFETSLRSLWRHSNESSDVMYMYTAKCGYGYPHSVPWYIMGRMWVITYLIISWSSHQHVINRDDLYRKQRGWYYVMNICTLYLLMSLW